MKTKPVILITGASQGIGAEIARVFAREVKGMRLGLVARNEKKLAAVAKGCAKLGAKVEVFGCDVTDEHAVAELVIEVKKRLGEVDVLVNNAGAFKPEPFLRSSVETFDEMIRVNLRSAFLVTRAFVPGMVQRGRGDVFFMSSIAGLDAYPASAAYCAAKFGVTGLAKVLREETKGTGVRVCCIHPGATWTPSWSESGVKEERIMPAADVARAFFDVYRMTRRTVVEEVVLRPNAGDIE